MSLSYSSLNQLFKIHPSWRLLRAENAPLILSFLDKVFVQPNVRFMTQANLVSKLEDTLYQLRISEGAQSFPRTAQEYLDDWAKNEKGWLRKFYPVGSDEPHYDLTPATEKVLTWVESLTAKTFVGTESRLLTIFELLKQIVYGSETDAETRIAELEKRKAELDNQIQAIKSGNMELMDETSIRDRFLQFSTMARELLSDFRAVEHNFRQLDSRVREKIATWDGTKGALLEQIFGDRDVIVDSDQGKSFKAFWDFLMSSRSQEEFTSLLEKVFSMDAVKSIAEDRRLRRIHFDWLEAGEHTQRTVASLSQQLRRYLDNQAYLENKRIMEILDSIAKKALQVKECIPSGNS
jgi:flagellar motility protein MotE (MotC chaperone)